MDNGLGYPVNVDGTWVDQGTGAYNLGARQALYDQFAQGGTQQPVLKGIGDSIGQQYATQLNPRGIMTYDSQGPDASLLMLQNPLGCNVATGKEYLATTPLYTSQPSDIYGLPIYGGPFSGMWLQTTESQPGNVQVIGGLSDDPHKKKKIPMFGLYMGDAMGQKQYGEYEWTDPVTGKKYKNLGKEDPVVNKPEVNWLFNPEQFFLDAQNRANLTTHGGIGSAYAPGTNIQFMPGVPPDKSIAVTVASGGSVTPGSRQVAFSWTYAKADGTTVDSALSALSYANCITGHQTVNGSIPPTALDNALLATAVGIKVWSTKVGETSGAMYLADTIPGLNTGTTTITFALTAADAALGTAHVDVQTLIEVTPTVELIGDVPDSSHPHTPRGTNTVGHWGSKTDLSAFTYDGGNTGAHDFYALDEDHKADLAIAYGRATGEGTITPSLYNLTADYTKTDAAGNKPVISERMAGVGRFDGGVQTIYLDHSPPTDNDIPWPASFGSIKNGILAVCSNDNTEWMRTSERWMLVTRTDDTTIHYNRKNQLEVISLAGSDSTCSPNQATTANGSTSTAGGAGNVQPIPSGAYSPLPSNPAPAGASSTTANTIPSGTPSLGGSSQGYACNTKAAQELAIAIVPNGGTYPSVVTGADSFEQHGTPSEGHLVQVNATPGPNGGAKFFMGHVTFHDSSAGGPNDQWYYWGWLADPGASFQADSRGFCYFDYNFNDGHLQVQKWGNSSTADDGTCTAVVGLHPGEVYFAIFQSCDGQPWAFLGTSPYKYELCYQLQTGAVSSISLGFNWAGGVNGSTWAGDHHVATVDGLRAFDSIPAWVTWTDPSNVVHTATEPVPTPTSVPSANSAAYQAGYSAELAGTVRTANPYTAGSADHTAWDEGWVDAWNDSHPASAALSGGTNTALGNPSTPSSVPSAYDTAYQAGYTAYATGYAQQTNPYLGVDQTSATYWSQGWVDAWNAYNAYPGHLMPGGSGAGTGGAQDGSSNPAPTTTTTVAAGNTPNGTTTTTNADGSITTAVTTGGTLSGGTWSGGTTTSTTTTPVGSSGECGTAPIPIPGSPNVAGDLSVAGTGTFANTVNVGATNTGTPGTTSGTSITPTGVDTPSATITGTAGLTVNTTITQSVLAAPPSTPATGSGTFYLQTVSGVSTPMYMGSDGVAHNLLIPTSTTLADATTTAVGVVEIDQAPVGPHPVALTTRRLGTAGGAAKLDDSSMIPSLALPTGEAAGVVAEQGRWTRSGSNPILSPSLTWEATAVEEPSVLFENGVFKMWYTGGWTAPGMGYATSTDGITWTKHSTPVLGQGGSSVSGTVCRVNVVKVAGKYYCYYGDSTSTANLMVSTSTDGISWTTPTQVFASNAVAWSIGWANSTVWVEDGTWTMILDGRDTGTTWQIARATSLDGITWTLDTTNQFLTSLQVASGGMYGGPTMVGKRNGLYHLWYHAANVSGNLPTDIYHATSLDTITWTQVSGGAVLTHLGTGFEIDQVADPCIVEAKGKTFLFYDGEDNPTSAGHIGVATFTGTLAQVVDGARQLDAVPNGFAPLDSSGKVPLADLPSIPLSQLGQSSATTGQVPTWNGSAYVPATPATSSGELLVADGITNPPVAMYLDDGTDFMYQG